MGRRTIVLVVALLLAGISALAVWRFLSQVEDDAREGLNEVTVFRAAVLIPRGAAGVDVLIDIDESTELEEFLPDNAVSSRDDLVAALTNKVALGPISRNQIITTDQFGDPAEELATLAELLEPGMQAISIRPDEVRAVGGFLTAGDRINVIASTQVDLSSIANALRAPAARAIFFPTLQEELGLTDEEMVQFAEALPARLQFTQFVLQGIEVLAVGAEVGGEAIVDDEGFASAGNQIITLAVTAEQAEQLVFSQEYLATWLTLVPEGFEPEETTGAQLDDLIDLPEQFIEELRLQGLIVGAAGGPQLGGGTGTSDGGASEVGGEEEGAGDGG